MTEELVESQGDLEPSAGSVSVRYEGNEKLIISEEPQQAWKLTS